MVKASAIAGILALFVAVIALVRDATNYEVGTGDRPASPTNSQQEPTPIEAPQPLESPATAEPAPSTSFSPLPAASVPSNEGSPIKIVNIIPGHGGRIGPDTYRTGATPGFNIEVFTSAGQVEFSEPCYVAWTYLVDGVARSSARSHCQGGGITNFSTGPLKIGRGRVVADVTTDWGATARQTLDFIVTA